MIIIHQKNGDHIVEVIDGEESYTARFYSTTGIKFTKSIERPSVANGKNIVSNHTQILRGWKRLLQGAPVRKLHKEDPR